MRNVNTIIDFSSGSTPNRNESCEHFKACFDQAAYKDLKLDCVNLCPLKPKKESQIKRRGNFLTDEKRAKILECIRQGMKYHEIRVECHVSLETIWKLKKLIR